MSKQPYLECGQIVNTHGVAGDVKAESWCDTPRVLAGLQTLYRKKGETYLPISVRKASVFKQFVIFALEGVGDLDAANALRGTVLYAARQDLPLPQGGFFIADLLGLPVKDAENGQTYGTLTDLINRGASDIYVIQTPSGERMMPAVKEFVKRIDTEEGIFVSPIEGMLD